MIGDLEFHTDSIILLPGFAVPPLYKMPSMGSLPDGYGRDIKTKRSCALRSVTSHNKGDAFTK